MSDGCIRRLAWRPNKRRSTTFFKFQPEREFRVINQPRFWAPTYQIQLSRCPFVEGANK